MSKRLALLLLLLSPFALPAAPAITVSGNSVTVLGSAQTISLTCTLIDPNNTGNLRSGSNIITTFITSTATPSNVATCGPIYGNDVITDGYGNANTTYYKVQVFTVSGGIVASTPSLQQFYAFTGSGTIDLATATPLAPSFFTGPTGNVVMPGTLNVTGATTLTNLTVSGTGTFTNINNVQWAGPGATPTIDQAVTACGANPCTVYISSSYSGAESANIVTTSSGYLVYSGANNITIVDLRANAATPVTPANALQYPIGFGGRQTGQLTRFFVNYWSSSPNDSTSGASFTNWFTGTFPSNGGSIIGANANVFLHDSISGTPSTPVAMDAEAQIASTSAVTLPTVLGSYGVVNIPRTNAATSITDAVGVRGGTCTNVSSSGATITNCYGVEGLPQSLGTSRNYSFHSYRKMLYESGGGIDWADNGGTTRQFFAFSDVTAGFVVDARPFTDGASFLGNTAGGWAGIYFKEEAAPSFVAGKDACFASSTTHTLQCSYNNGSSFPIAQTANSSGTHSDSGFYQSKRAVAGCTTGAAAGNSCASDITVTWGAAFADANYSVTCTGSTPTNVPSAPFVVSGTKLAATVHINYFAITAAAASYSTIDCIAVHD